MELSNLLTAAAATAIIFLFFYFSVWMDSHKLQLFVHSLDDFSFTIIRNTQFKTLLCFAQCSVFRTVSSSLTFLRSFCFFYNINNVVSSSGYCFCCRIVSIFSEEKKQVHTVQMQNIQTVQTVQTLQSTLHSKLDSNLFRTIYFCFIYSRSMEC